MPPRKGPRPIRCFSTRARIAPKTPRFEARQQAADGLRQNEESRIPPNVGQTITHSHGDVSPELPPLWQSYVGEVSGEDAKFVNARLIFTQTGLYSLVTSRFVDQVGWPRIPLTPTFMSNPNKPTALGLVFVFEYTIFAAKKPWNDTYDKMLPTFIVEERNFPSHLKKLYYCFDIIFSAQHSTPHLTSHGGPESLRVSPATQLGLSNDLNPPQLVPEATESKTGISIIGPSYSDLGIPGVLDSISRGPTQDLLQSSSAALDDIGGNSEGTRGSKQPRNLVTKSELLTDSGYASGPLPRYSASKRSEEVIQPVEDMSREKYVGIDEEDCRTTYSAATTLATTDAQKYVDELSQDIHGKLRAELNPGNWPMLSMVLPDLVRAFSIRIAYESSSQVNRDIMYFIHKHNW
jgi:hypothetical protein